MRCNQSAVACMHCRMHGRARAWALAWTLPSRWWSSTWSRGPGGPRGGGAAGRQHARRRRTRAPACMHTCMHAQAACKQLACACSNCLDYARSAAAAACTLVQFNQLPTARRMRRPALFRLHACCSKLEDAIGGAQAVICAVGNNGLNPSGYTQVRGARGACNRHDAWVSPAHARACQACMPTDMGFDLPPSPTHPVSYVSDPPPLP